MGELIGSGGVTGPPLALTLPTLPLTPLLLPQPQATLALLHLLPESDQQWDHPPPGVPTV